MNSINQKKEVGILWSAGLDSTFLVVDNLRKGNVVHPIYISVDNNKEKVEREKSQRDKMYQILKNQYHDLLREPFDVATINITTCWGAERLHLKQVPLWILGMMYIRDSIQELQVGYVMGDDAVSYMSEIQKIYQSYRPIMGPGMPKLVFPLVKEQKQRIWTQLPENIRQLTVFCEGQTEKDCGFCHSCERYKYLGLFDRYERNVKSSDIDKGDVESPTLKELVDEYSDTKASIEVNDVEDVQNDSINIDVDASC
jgi:7-cyano-7-deazaguanine synthase in queuosine biosynthesis